jgi:esterase/lipase superfamily enzyme
MKTPGDGLLIFVHGFSTSHADAIRTAGVLGESLHKTVFVYDWASSKDATFPSRRAYEADEENLQASFTLSRSFFAALLGSPGASNVSILAHSMGSRFGVDLATFFDNFTKIDSVVFAAGDVQLVQFKLSLRSLRHFSSSLACYASSDDIALKSSHWLHNGNMRLGEDAKAVAAIGVVESIDATLAGKRSLTDPMGHGYFETPLLLRDIDEYFHKVSLGSRRYLQQSSPPEPFYYVFKSSAI